MTFTPSRRQFGAGLASLAFAGFAARTGLAEDVRYRSEVTGYGPLVRDPAGLLDLPQGFSYRVLSELGQRMDDGFRVPDAADGMGLVPLGANRVALIRNHELKDSAIERGPTGGDKALIDRLARLSTYDGTLPGGTSTLIVDTRTNRLVSQHLSLAGTAVNCAGGVTPWGSWISCEETVARAGDGRTRDHGWAFEVPANARGLSDAVPLTGLGRFKHEAAAVDPRTGIVYLTEDEQEGLFYRFLPNVRGRLSAGGRLQAMGFADAPQGGDGRNWAGSRPWTPGSWKRAVWIDVDGPDNPDGDLRLRMHKAGAARMARLEGVHFGKDELYFTCTSGGARKCGQIMRYVPSRHEGQPGERDDPGMIQLFVESTDPSVLDFADNITLAPWGHLVVCEDKYVENPMDCLRGITPEGKVYALAQVRIDTEPAGVCFSPDGRTLFVNIYSPAKTLAITGPWNSFRA